MSKILKNTTGLGIELEVGVSVPANSSLEINQLDYLELAESVDIEGYINSGDILVNDGINDLPIQDGLNYIKFPNFAESVRLDSLSLSSTNVKDALEELKNVAGNDYGLFAIWAEENAGLGNGQMEWSFGNGSTGDIGIVLPIDADLFSVSYNADNAGTNTEIAVTRNSSTQVATTGSQSGEDGFNELSVPVSFNAGDRVGFQTITAGGAVDVRVCAWFKVPLSTLVDLELGQLSDVEITNPNSGEVLTYNGIEWVNQTLPIAPVDSVNGQTGVVVLDADDISDTSTVNKFATQAQLDQILTNATDIAVNVGNISNNNININTNANNITTNSNNIITNTNNIAQNVSDIAQNVSDIAQNSSDISSNTTSINDHINDSANPHATTFTQAVNADTGTDITSNEAEELTDGSITSLHKHRVLVDESGNTKIEVVDGGDINLNDYPQTRNDITSNDEKVLTTDASGNLKLRRVLPFHVSIKKISNSSGSVGINQTTTLETYLQLNINIPEEGNYDIDWTYVWSINTTSQDFIGDMFLDNNPISTYSEHRQETQDSAGSGINLSNTTGGTTNTRTDQRIRYTAFETERQLSAGNHTLEIKWAGSGNNLEPAIYEGSIRVKRTS